MKKTSKSTKIIVAIIIVLALIAGGTWYLFFLPSNPWNATTISEIPTPSGFHRVPVEKGSYAEYLRTLPLKPKGAKAHYYDGSEATAWQAVVLGVIDQDMFSNNEQCADVVMRLRAEYLWKHGRYSEIAFANGGGKKLRYQGGASRSAFKKYMCQVYDVANTSSMFDFDTKPRKFKDVQIGDVFVYRNIDKGHPLGHAMVVADMAVNDKGQKAVLIVEGVTPATEKHVLRNRWGFGNNRAWFIIDKDDHDIRFTLFKFEESKGQLRHY